MHEISTNLSWQELAWVELPPSLEPYRQEIRELWKDQPEPESIAGTFTFCWSPDQTQVLTDRALSTLQCKILNSELCTMQVLLYGLHINYYPQLDDKSRENLTFAHLVVLSRDKLLRMRQFGESRVQKVEAFLAENDLTLGIPLPRTLCEAIALQTCIPIYPDRKVLRADHYSQTWTTEKR